MIGWIGRVVTKKESSPAVMDWCRVPLSGDEENFMSDAFYKVLSFYLGMSSVAERYESEASRQRLIQAVNAIVLNAWDGYLIKKSVLMEQNDESAAFAKRIGVEWGFLSNTAFALSVAGVLSMQTVEKPEAPHDPDFLITAYEGLGDNLTALKAAVLDHSEPLDVHTWSEHPEANVFVNHIYTEHFATGNADIRKKHIKVLLLDLYVRWTIDPSLKTGLSRNVNSYEPKSRYNALHISKLMPAIADRLEEVGLIRQAIGHTAHDGRPGHITRIWPTGMLIMMFEDAKFGPVDIADHADREVIILRDVDPNDDEKQIEIDYKDTPRTHDMRFLLRAYNELLRRTFIDIPTLEAGFINLSAGSNGKPRRLQVNQRDKFTRRIFNRGSFDKGGRFWGGWWQRCPKEWREKIFIDDKPTSELDYSGLHIVMLYAREDINYWNTVGTDPYEIDLPGFEGTSEELRTICKQLILVALNAKDEKATFFAFRDEAETGSAEKRMGNRTLSLILNLLREKHAPIAHMLANDAGIDLMNQDARIAERIISHFTRKGIPILAIHDSFIVPLGLERELNDAMQQAFASVMKVPGIKVKEVTSLPFRAFRLSPSRKTALPKPSPDDFVYLGHRVVSPDISEFFASVESRYQARHNPKRTSRYQAKIKRFHTWNSGQ